jgi:hypothetical protein
MILTGNANTTRAIPGQRYGIAAHSTTMVPAPAPTCECPCHLNEKPSAAGVYCPECSQLAVAVLGKDEETIAFTHDDLLKAPRDTREWMVAGPPDYWFVTKGNTLSDELNEHFPSNEKAQARADELNERDVIRHRRLTKKQEARARALHELASHSWFAEDDFYWLRKDVKRYAVEAWWEDGDTTWDTYATLAEVEERIRESDIGRVVDLDTGDDVPFTRTVSVNIADAAAMLEP